MEYGVDPNRIALMGMYKFIAKQMYKGYLFLDGAKYNLEFYREVIIFSHKKNQLSVYQKLKV